MAKIESGRIDLFIESVPIREIVNDCLGLIAPLAMKHGIEILLASNGKIFRESELKHLDIILDTDHVRLRQVLLNLISNAVKYNHPGDTVLMEELTWPGALSVGRLTGIRMMPVAIDDEGL